ncbi:MAG: 1-acyl-sn-glycerol-3-phosphate acyltransferase [Gemmatimonadetes bacterium]|uniref:1-acyl-sn-glycerol-3-phosphate acyltransferase n=1 Tax=Candidatus Kutchimonas denitrificans TaxID=3056748 RepID=A0AAE4ZCL8_9BACT|nr:1-acyl-sn-glycerol-3-phosphate acyltransferase [Gemmatimonadota bacterium]NIR76076.1 1-acyl-sn-glycerol-3-phosphate acyltransferase [Candidatus Kutchimonas denitrificans]NIS00455.1 1-acyl-sn-glycerol-3-phosphate acyltransferase [Gemmatimonadota bacterium]NIT66113.1 1-acyl-sn-glycerol-3-phosphate acyltransferase [Gemmatimonadota bacterium]NIU54191.1 hypothetical protein [Gemmatimonadota bacterium]
MKDFLGLKRFARSILKQPRARKGRVSNVIWHFVSWVVVNVSVTLSWPFWFILNRATVIGRENVGEAPNTLLLSNHQSMIDSMPIGVSAFYPKSLIKPYVIPWHPAASENFFKHPTLAWISFHFRCIPVKPGRRDLKALYRMIDVLPYGTMSIFPEGTRSRTGYVKRGRAGPGLLILATRPTVIPVAIDGMQDVLPIGKTIPRIGKRIWIKFGKPVDYSEFLDKPRTRETAQALVDKVMEIIRAQHRELRQMRIAHYASKDKNLKQQAYPPELARHVRPDTASDAAETASARD